MYMIETEGLKKSFTVPRLRKKVEAVRGVDLHVVQGEIFGFLGPNGAGKTTTQRLLTTLLSPDGGKAQVAGHDLIREPLRVRERIGAISQSGGADENATGRENLVLQARFYGMSGRAAKVRAAELIANLEMAAFADRMVRTYSGGQRRRLDLGLGIVHRPALLFLDEPSSGLDPQSRALLWQEVRALQQAGTTIFLTTHYLEEADALCNRLAIIDGGTIVAEGTPVQLKQRIAGDVITLTLDHHTEVQSHAHALLHEQPFVRDIKDDEKALQVYVDNGEEALAQILHLLEGAHLAVHAVALSRPSLDTVFLHLTGHAFKDTSH